jgi:trigger factor
VKSVAEPLGPTRVKLLVEVPFEELQPSLDAAYQRIAGQVNVPGFRRGKVPARVIDQRFGRGAVLEEAINDALPSLYSQAVGEAEVRPLGTPSLDVTELEDGQHLKFTVEVDVRPEISLPPWEGVALTVDDAVVTDEQVDTQLQQLRARFGTLTPVERAAAPGDHVVLDLGAMDDDGEDLENGRATGLTYEVGSESMVEGLDEAVTGLAAGESATFSTTLLGDADGVAAEVEVTVTAVKEQELPELDDEFATMASEFDTLEELRADIREQLMRMARIGQALSARDKALEYLLDAVDVPLPENAIAAQVDEHFADGHGDDDHRAEVQDQTARSLKAQLILDEIVKAAEVGVAQDEIMEYLVQRAQQSRVSPQEYIDQVVQSGNVPAIVADVARGKALALVVEKAVVSDESGNPVDLTRLQEDGTLLDVSEVVDDVEAVAEVDVAPSAGDVTFAQVSGVEEPAEADAQDAPTANKSDAAE